MSRNTGEPPPGRGPTVAVLRPDPSEDRSTVRAVVVGTLLTMLAVLLVVEANLWADRRPVRDQLWVIVTVAPLVLGGAFLLRNGTGHIVSAGADWLCAPFGAWVDTTHLVDARLDAGRTTTYLHLHDADGRRTAVDLHELSASVEVWDAFYAALLVSLRTGLVPHGATLEKIYAIERRLHADRPGIDPTTLVHRPPSPRPTDDRRGAPQLPKRRDLPPDFVIEDLTIVGTTWYGRPVRYWLRRVSVSAFFAALTLLSLRLVWSILASILHRSAIGFVVALALEAAVTITATLRLRHRPRRRPQFDLGLRLAVIVWAGFVVTSLVLGAVYLALGICVFLGPMFVITIETFRPLRTDVAAARARARRRLGLTPADPPSRPVRRPAG